MNNKLPNLVNQKYLVSNTNAVLCSDITQISNNAYLCYILDLGSRLVLGHILTEQYTHDGDVTLLVASATNNREIRGTILHTDLGGQYTAQEVKDLAEHIGLTLSFGKRASHENQVAEAFNRNIKRILRTLLVAQFSHQKKDPLARLSKKVSFERLSDLVTKAFEEYNSRPHQGKGMSKASPFSMDEALFQEKAFKVTHTRNNNSKKAVSVRTYRAEVLERYAGNWEQFFLDWKEEQSKQHQEVYDYHRKLSDQLSQQNAQLQHQIKFLVKEAEVGKQNREAKLASKEKTLSATKLSVRDSLTGEQFESILSLVQDNSYKASRVRLAFILLYYTGLRVSNLLVLKLAHIDELYDSQETNIALIKRGPERHFLSIGVEGQHFLTKYSQDILTLKERKQPNDFLFTASPLQAAKDKPLNALDRSNFDKELNIVLKKASAIVGKHLRTHSFRATFVTDLLNIDYAQSQGDHKAP